MEEIRINLLQSLRLDQQFFRGGVIKGQAWAAEVYPRDAVGAKGRGLFKFKRFFRK